MWSWRGVFRWVDAASVRRTWRTSSTRLKMARNLVVNASRFLANKECPVCAPFSRSLVLVSAIRVGKIFSRGPVPDMFETNTLWRRAVILSDAHRSNGIVHKRRAWLLLSYIQEGRWDAKYASIFLYIHCCTTLAQLDNRWQYPYKATKEKRETQMSRDALRRSYTSHNFSRDHRPDNETRSAIIKWWRQDMGLTSQREAGKICLFLW